MNVYLLTLSSIFLAVGVLTAIDGIVLVSGMSGIMFCLSIIGRAFEILIPTGSRSLPLQLRCYNLSYR